MSCRLYANVDELASELFAIHEKLFSIRADDPRVIRGEFCAKCGGGPSTKKQIRDTKEIARQRWREVCASCDIPWTPDVSGERDILRGEVQMPKRPGSYEGSLAVRIDEYQRLRRLLNRPRDWQKARWRFALQAWKMYLHPSLGSYAAVAEYGAGVQGGSASWWTEDIVKRWIGRARTVTMKRAQRRPRLLVPGARLPGGSTSGGSGHGAGKRSGGRRGTTLRSA